MEEKHMVNDILESSKTEIKIYSNTLQLKAEILGIFFKESQILLFLIFLCSRLREYLFLGSSNISYSFLKMLPNRGQITTYLILQ